MSVYLGIDTSNYTTSAALYDPDSGRLVSRRRLLPVGDGERGLRQSDALFHHIKQLPDVLEAAFGDFGECRVQAVGVSSRPRDVEGSYMPAFLAGCAVADGIGLAGGVACHRFSHQAGHVAAALLSAKRTDLFSRPFLAFHVSGGTTEALLVEPDDDRILSCRAVAGSLDLKAGQAVDRVGVMLGLGFPAGPKMDELAVKSQETFRVRPSMKGRDCSLSGVENECRKLFLQGRPAEDIARYCLEKISVSLQAMADGLREDYPGLPMVFAGGVMSNSLLSARFSKRYDGIFAPAQFSSDNAAGIALLAAVRSGMDPAAVRINRLDE